jgi:hypothetical protein
VELLEDRSVPSTVSSLTANFNGTPIPGGDTLWFSSVMSVSGLPKSTSATVHVTNAQVSLTAGGTPYTVAVPDADIVFTPGAAAAAVSSDPTDGDLDVSAPSGGPGNVFMGGVSVPVPVGGLPGGIKNVTWTASFSSDTANLKVTWQWSAAVYSNFSSDNNAIGIKAVDANNLTVYTNNDHAGTPEAYRSYVVGGATGGGGSNYTGNLTPNTQVTPAVLPASSGSSGGSPVPLRERSTAKRMGTPTPPTRSSARST